ncbi:hypothetical protein SEA_FUZZBUSTER_60 [Microbacterium phage FuzzBuster]|uniref:Uncharacterized protein n=1 Tax=Microbacterium phage FuzzBuster TaxID=2590935 RepID=A0A516KV40_9CAUD|nr:hypothetical protein SEA_FUZZBUSTER_60 [Microbacterium phage FuzzBuster]
MAAAIHNLSDQHPKPATTAAGTPEEKGPIMAKDKGKKKDDEKVEKKAKKGKAEEPPAKKGKKSKAEEAPAKGKKSKGGDSDGFAKPSEAPASGDGWQFTDDDHLGDLFLITPLRVEEIEDKFHPGEKKEIIVADIVHLNEKKPEKSELHENAWVFQGYLKGSLRGYIGQGQRVLGRLAKGDKKDRGNYPWILEDADDDDMKVAKAYVKYINDPLNAGKKSSDDDAKGGKKKKAKK